MNTMSGSSTSSRPRDAIGGLCRLMNLGTITSVSPEVFRQAKFNKQEAVAPLWSLLNSLAHYSKQSRSHPDGLSQRDIVSSAKHAMRIKSYHCWQFYCLPDDMSSGSRELLLACGWLLAKTDILMNLMRCDTALVPDTRNLHSEEVRELQQQKDLRGKREANTDDQVCGRVKYLGWLLGRCKMAMRRLYLQQQELCSLTHQIHVATHGVSMTADSTHLSPMETYLLRHSEQLKKHYQVLEAEQSRLHICLKWQEQQSTFWQWMESVLDARLQDPSADEIPHRQDSSDGYPKVFPNANPTPMTKLLQDSLRELESLTQQLQSLGGDTDYEDDHRTGSKMSSIAEDIKAQLVLPASPHPSPLGLCQTARFHLVKKQHKPTSTRSMHSRPPDATHVQEEIARLSSIVEELECELRDLRTAHCFKMDDLASMLQDAVCIPPIGSAS